MFKKAFYVIFWGAGVAGIGVLALRHRFPIGPIILVMTLLPLAGLFFSGRLVKGAIPDIIFGVIDTGLLTIFALGGGIAFGIAGAIAGGVIGDALTDAIAGFFEGSIAAWLRKKGIDESREPITSALGKMAGCLLGSGFILSIAFGFGIKVNFG